MVNGSQTTRRQANPQVSAAKTVKAMTSEQALRDAFNRPPASLKDDLNEPVSNGKKAPAKVEPLTKIESTVKSEEEVSNAQQN